MSRTQNNDRCFNMSIYLRVNDETKWALEASLPKAPGNEEAAILFMIEKFGEYVRGKCV